MPTKKPRINITFDAITVEVLIQMAKKKHKSVSSLVKEFVLSELERREDKALSAIADAIDVPNMKRVKHEDAWK